MNRAIAWILLAACAACLAASQTPEAPAKVEIADIRYVSSKTADQYVHTGPVHDGRYEVGNATMVDLVRIAYDVTADRVLGGPNWLDLDRFDVTAKVPADSTTESRRDILQAVLADRFKLVVHKDTKPVPTFVLSMGKKPLLKEAAGTEPSGCKVNSDSGSPPESGSGVVMMTTSSSGAAPTRIVLGPGMTVQYQCRNMTMAAFADGLHTLMGTNLGPKTILDDTGLEGKWNFDLRYSMSFSGGMPGSASDRISLYDAIEKQLGLKLEEKPVPAPVIVVDSVNRQPTANPPGVAEALPPIPVPTEFEVASIKPSDPGVMSGMSRTESGGRLTSRGMPLRYLVYQAFNTNNPEYVVGLPKFTDTDRYDVIAKAPGAGSGAQVDDEAVHAMVRALLAERCKMTYHKEDRQVSAYALVAGKPKMKKADPESRASCKTANSPAGAPPGSTALTCRNVTMAQFAERLQNLTPELAWAVADATGIEGGWDLTLTFTRSPMVAMRTGGPGPDPGPGGSAVPSAAEPAGGETIFEAIEKQLGLKLEKKKRAEPVIVIDTFEKPSEN